MIIGMGSDLIDIRRIETSISRFGERFTHRCFTDIERARSDRRKNRAESYAKRFAAKEALIKALGDSTGVQWHDMQVVSDGHGNPRFELSGAAAAVAQSVGATRLHLSMSHDAGVAIAYVVAES